MAGHLPSTAARKGPSIAVILIIYAALFILFLWFNFVLSQEIESVGREIQVRTEELNASLRQRDALLKEISVVGSQERMSERATELGYQPQTPVFLSVAEPLVPAGGDVMGNGQQSASFESGGEQPMQEPIIFLELLARQPLALQSETRP
jgi:hypothetical protein